MPKDILQYTNGEVTVVWKPKVCIHSTLCWKGLNGVFNPRERPWIKLDGADTGRIIAQVSKCPSGALSYFRNNETAAGPAAIQEPGNATAEAVRAIKVVVSANGPYLIDTECLIIHSDGRKETKTGAVALCRCGGSQNKPYCDGSHKRIGFSQER